MRGKRQKRETDWGEKGERAWVKYEIINKYNNKCVPGLDDETQIS